MESLYLNETQINAELKRCLKCPTKPCLKACPAQVSPHDFIKAARDGDFAEAAKLIETQNPLGEICGLICPERFCQKACVRGKIDKPIEIQALQAAIMQRARTEGVSAENTELAAVNKKVAVVGAGPAGIAAAVELLRHGVAVTMFEKANCAGGALNYIPSSRLPHQIIDFTFKKLQQNPLFEIKFGIEQKDYEVLRAQGFEAVIVATGTQKIRTLGIEGEDYAVLWHNYLKFPNKYNAKKVAIVGGGAVAADCAVTAIELGAVSVEMFVRRRVTDMRISERERQRLFENNILITDMTRPLKIKRNNNKLSLITSQTRFNDQGKLEDVPQSIVEKDGYDLIILALGSDSAESISELPGVVYAGDVINGASTAVEAVASGKKAVQTLLSELLA